MRRKFEELACVQDAPEGARLSLGCVAVDDFAGAKGVFQLRQGLDVGGGIFLEDGEIGLEAGSDASEIFFCAESARGSGGERGENLGKSHARLGHERVFLGGIVFDGAEIGAEEDFASGG